MSRWRRFLCWVGWHDWRPSPKRKTPEEMGKLIAEAKDGWQVLGYMLVAGRLAKLEECAHCHHETP